MTRVHVVVCVVLTSIIYCESIKNEGTICNSVVCDCNHVYGVVSCSCDKHPNQELTVNSFGNNKLPSNTKTFEVHKCRLVHISRNAFQGLTELHRITLSNISRISMESSAFKWNESSPHLVQPRPGIVVSVSHSSIDLIPSSTFVGSIEGVLFNNVEVGKIESFAFSTLYWVSRIEITNSKIKSIETQAFKKFPTKHFVLQDTEFKEDIPSRAFVEIEVWQDLQWEAVKIPKLRSSALSFKEVNSFKFKNCVVNKTDSDAFRITVGGPVFIQNNVFNSVQTGAFLGINVEKRVIDNGIPEPYLFENNTIHEFEKGALIFNKTGFEIRLENIFVDKGCECPQNNNWTSDLFRTPIFITPYNYPDLSRRNTDALWCWSGSASPKNIYQRFPEYYKSHCQQSSQIHIAIIVGIAVLILIIIGVLVVFFCRRAKNKKKDWKSVATNDNGVIKNEPKKIPARETVAVILPDGRTYQETEFHVVFESAKALADVEIVPGNETSNENK